MANRIPLARQIECVEREIKMRERAYPRWCGQGKMTLEKAGQELEAMKGVLETLREIEASTRLI
jgi:signal recognition particle subunit SEC65